MKMKKMFKVELTTTEIFEVEADNKDNAHMMVLEGLPSDEERGRAEIRIAEIKEDD